MGLGQGCLEHIKSLEIRGLYLYWMSIFQEFVWTRAASWKHRRNLNRRAELCLLRRSEGEF